MDILGLKSLEATESDPKASCSGLWALRAEVCLRFRA